MKASPLLIAWHNDKAPIYSAHFEPHGKQRLATAGGDNNVRLWQVETNGEERKATYLSTLIKHTQAVNVVRWCPRGELLASAGDDGNVLLWAPSEVHNPTAFGEDHAEDKETWIVKKMCRSNSGSEIYDLAWSPDGVFFITGSMDNIARIFDASTGGMVRQIAEHNHYVQGVAWDPLNEFLATQSSDRSVHIYRLRTNDGQFSLAQHNKVAKMDLPARRPSTEASNTTELGGHRSLLSSENIPQPTNVPSSPAPSAPGTPPTFPLPMNPPPPTTHSRRSSFGAASPSVRRSASPAPSIPLPAVMPAASPNPKSAFKNANIYANETLTSFFRRLTFAPDGSLLFTPAGQYKQTGGGTGEAGQVGDEVINTVYIYSRGGLNKPPIAHLPGHKKPSIAVRCSPIFYNLRLTTPTKHITIDTSSTTSDLAPLPEPVLSSKPQPSMASMDPPRTIPSPSPSIAAGSPRQPEPETGNLPNGPSPAFALNYRMIYAVATQDAIYLYDTQQQSPICVVSNLHFATFTDLAWSSDGLTLLIASSDGFCSVLTFNQGELGTEYHGTLSSRIQAPANINTNTSAQSTPAATPTTQSALPMGKPPSSAGIGLSPSPVSTVRPASPTRSESASSVATTPGPGVVVSNPTPTIGNVPGVAATAPGSVTGAPLTSPTPPMTPSQLGSNGQSNPPGVLGKRVGEGERDDAGEHKKRRVAPTLISKAESQGETSK